MMAITKGQFGLWKETGDINEIINRTFENKPESGLGEAVGRAILEGEYPYKEISVFAAAARLGIPATGIAQAYYQLHVRRTTASKHPPDTPPRR